MRPMAVKTSPEGATQGSQGRNPWNQAFQQTGALKGRSIRWVAPSGLGSPPRRSSQGMRPWLSWDAPSGLILTAMRMRARWPVILCLAVCGCADIAAARRAQDASAAPPGERTILAKDVGLDTADAQLTLDRGLEISLASNSSIAASHARVESAEARIKELRGPLGPQVTISSNYRASWSAQGVDDPQESHSEGITLSQLLFDFGKTSAQAKQASDQYVAALSDLQNQRNDIALGYLSAHFGVLKQQGLVRVAEENVEQFEKRLEQVEGFVKAGIRIRYDVTKAQVDLGNARLQLVQARTALTKQRATLENALGLAEDAPFRLVDGSLADVGLDDFGALLARARESHPKLAALVSRESAASSALDAAVADLAPAISFQGGFTGSGDLVSPTVWSAFLSPVFNWVLFNGGAKSARVREAIGALREARALRAQEEQQVFLDLRQAVSLRDDAMERLSITTLTLKSAQENSDLVQGLYAAGRASSVELTDAQVALSKAQGDQVTAQYDYQIAIATVMRAIGTTR